ncbi:hypothetical protein [Corynebacterium antarcticum]|uniref:hypothetical protein n=1 Tax=Corynebacterium antarcticum TaxID=2800405 RepID=UPI0022609DAD|nr:hypothetical protein [Corynebacterium antarcticum]MCX7540316.1 hypothetical protein [Corynebacterium antarcticum]
MNTMLIWRGHKTLISSQLLITCFLTAIMSGILGVVVSATDKANDLKKSDITSVELVQRVNILDGIAVYSILVFTITAVVSLMMTAAIIQFIIANTSPTIRSLRIYGVPQTTIRFSFSAISTLCSLAAFISSVFLSPLVVAVYKFTLSMTGLDANDIGYGPNVPITLWVSLCMGAFSLSVAFWSSKNVSALEKPKKSHICISHTFRFAVRLGLFIMSIAGLLAILKTPTTIENVNEITFGAMFTALIATWCASPLIIAICGRLIKRFSARGLYTGGLIYFESRKLSGLSLIASLLLGVAGTSTILTLASSTAGEYLAMNSISADAVTPERVEKTTNDVQISAFDFDKGWLFSDDPLRQAPLILFNPSAFDEMLDPSTIVAGSLANVDKEYVVADAEKHDLGDKISIINGDGIQRNVIVVALSKRSSIFKGALGANAESFTPSGVDNVQHRSYAKASGGLDMVSNSYPENSWKSVENFVSDDLKSAQSAQIFSILSMVGGISIVALFGLLYSAVQFSIAQRKTVFSLRRIGAGPSSHIFIFTALGFVMALSSATVSGLALLAARSRVGELFRSLDIPQSPGLPSGILFGLWILTSTAATIGMISGQQWRK